MKRVAAANPPATLLSRALGLERLLASLAPPHALPWDSPHLRLQRPSPPPAPPDTSSLLSSLADCGQHAEAGVLLLAATHGGLRPLAHAAVGDLLVSAARSNGLVLSTSEVAAVVGLGRSTLPEATLLRMLRGHCTHGRYSEALALAAELVRAGSPQAERAQQLVLEAAAAERAGEAALPAQQGGAALLAELTVRALLDPALPHPEVQVYTSTLAGLLRLPSALREAGLARCLWGACMELQGAAGRQVPLNPSMRTYLLGAALVSGDVHTLRSVLMHHVASSGADSLPSLLLLRCSAAFAAAEQWQDALDTLQLVLGDKGQQQGQGAWPAGGAVFAAAPSAAAPPAPLLTPGATHACPLWHLSFLDASTAAAGSAADSAGRAGVAAIAAASGAAFPPSRLDGVPQDLLLHELAIQALSKLGRHEAALELWERERVEQRLLGFLETPLLSPAPRSSSAAAASAPPPPRAAAAAAATTAAGDSLPHLIASNLALGRLAALEPLFETFVMRSTPLPLSSRPALLKAYSDWVLAVAPTRASPDGLMQQLVTACREDASRNVTAYLLEAALKLYAPTSSAEVVVDTGRLSGTWAEEAEGTGTLDLHYSVQSAALALERTRFQSLLAIVGSMQARGIPLPGDAPHAAALHALQLNVSVGDTSEQLDAAVQAWMKAHPLHTCTSLLTSSIALLNAMVKSSATLAHPARAPPASATPRFVYEALIRVSQCLADAVVASLGPASAQPLTPLECSLRLVMLDVLAVAQACSHERLLTQASSSSSSSSSSSGSAIPLKQMLACLLLPLNRHSEGLFHQGSWGDSQVDLTNKGVEGLSVSPSPLLHAAGSVLSALAQQARQDPAVLQGWSSRDIEGFLLSTRRVIGGGQEAIVPRTLRALMQLHSSGSSSLHPLHVSYPAFSSLVTHLASTGAAWTLARVLCAVTLQEAPALGGGAALQVVGAGAPLPPNTTASIIHVPENVAKSAVIANSTVHLMENARSRGGDATHLASIMSLWLRAVGPQVRFEGGPRMPWTALLQGSGARQGDALGPLSLATTLPSLELAGPYRVLRTLPPPLGPEAVPSNAFDSFSDPAEAPPTALPTLHTSSPAAFTSIFGDAIVPLRLQVEEVEEQGAEVGGGAHSPQAAITMPSHVLSRLMRVAAITPSMEGLGQQQQQQQQSSPLPILTRELLRLGVWMDNAALDILADAAGKDPQLLLPLLQHLRAQAVATLQLLPGMNQGSLLPRLLPLVPICGLGVTNAVRVRLIAAAVNAGALRLALELLQDGPHYLRLPPATVHALLHLAHGANERAVVERLTLHFSSAASALAPPSEALPLAPPPSASLAQQHPLLLHLPKVPTPPAKQPANFFTEHLDRLTSKWLQASAVEGASRAASPGAQ